MNEMWDAVVVGGGLAGWIAGIRAAQRDKKVLLVTEGVGTLFYFSGIFDYGDVVRLRHLPKHPYTLFKAQEITQGQRFVQEICPEYVMKDTPQFAFTVLGTVRQGDLMPRSMVLPDQQEQGEFVILVPEGLKDFFPKIVAANMAREFPGWQVNEKRMKVGTLSEWTQLGKSVTSIDYASIWRSEEGQRALTLEIDQLKREYREAGRSSNKLVVVLPSLVREYFDSSRSKPYKNEFSLPILEMSSFVPSPHGRYFAEYLKHMFTDLGGELMMGARAAAINGKARSGSQTKVCQELVVNSMGKPLHLKSKKFILATGGFLGGGIKVGMARKSIREEVFDLPLFVPEKWSEPQFFAPQPFAQIGVETDALMRPLDPVCGQVIWDNVHVVGRMLAHWDPWTQRCGGGVSVTSGYAAAELI
ncbi:anaerobic glycerol-3-phosphate dehydrogenase, subunit B [Candidatus Desulfosporosinus infrequens]|uniref:Anaerobic glycerol-3-phosphate dehydrogenase, subunit B n=1 Tax=Candidatus Desulfosporosinus infrequens TaxID=2043169 RepID=A0A2U3LS64_9FIRM|nr:anaerobic glycerol-3-phosphate dehydrogenase, subunit B [Candidatus Desulfosporosinus infrequens]